MDEDCASFIRARDPSILAWNRPQIDPAIRIDLCSKYSDVSSSSSTKLDVTDESDTADHLEVFLRIKPSQNINSLYDFNETTLTCHVPPGSLVLKNIQDGNKVTKEYSFSKIYGPDVNQTELFNDSVKRKVLGFINGRNSTIFTYGTSGSGKTFTILGTSDAPGIIPRSLEYLFRTIPAVDERPKVKPTQSGEITVLNNSTEYANEQKLRNKLLSSLSTAVDKAYTQTYKIMQKRLSVEPTAIMSECPRDVSVSVWVSFAEVYNECIYDLLLAAPGRGTQRPKLRLGQDKRGNTFIRNLTHVSVCSGLQAYEILQYGMHNLNYAPTSINSHSSRSHCIFTIKLVQVSPDSKVQVSHFNFCDLAGSERVKNTRNVGERLKESNNINSSLHVLGRCIKSIRESQKSNDTKLVPFRESKLTRLFQQALTGQEAIAMVVNMNASRDMFDESQHVLNFSAIAKGITIERAAKQEKLPANKRFSQYIQSRSTAIQFDELTEPNQVDVLRHQVLTLTMELEQQRQYYMEKETEIRREIVYAFQERNKQMIHNWKMRMEEEKQQLVDSYKLQIENIVQVYNSELKRTQANTVIDLVHDECEDLKQQLKENRIEMERLENNLNDYKRTNSVLQVEKSQIEFQLSVQNSIVENDKRKFHQLSLDLTQLKNRNLELEQILIDAEKELTETINEKMERERKLEEKVLEVIHLKEELQNLQGVNSYYSKHLEQLEEKIESLEDTENESFLPIAEL